MIRPDRSTPLLISIHTMSQTGNWISIAESKFAWEREALEFVRRRFPDHEPYRAWSNFEFVGDDGSVNEVDLLVFTPQGFFLVEIKSQPGRLRGDTGTWVWEHEGKLRTVDNPYRLANSKAKKLRSLLQRQKASKGKGQSHSSRRLYSAPLPIFVASCGGRRGIMCASVIEMTNATGLRGLVFLLHLSAGNVRVWILNPRERMIDQRARWLPKRSSRQEFGRQTNTEKSAITNLSS